MKKLYIKNISIVLCLYIIFNLIFTLKSNIIGYDGSDYLNQHLVFLDYLKENFYNSYDLFPQLNMNMGLGQSMVGLYYHGLYNPFLLIIYIFPFENIFNDLMLIWIIFYILNSLFMTKLLKLNKINGNINTIATILYCFSTAIVYHISYHIMFVYYFPFFILSLIGLHYMIDKNKKSIYIIGLSLVFYTNFFFAPIVSVIQFLYYTFILYESNKITLKNYFKFFYSYIIGVLLGMFILIPIYLFGLTSRSEHNELSLTIFRNIFAVINDINCNSYFSFYIFISLFTLMGTFLILKEKKYYILIIPIILILISNHLILFLNVFQYVHRKIFIYMIPTFAIIFAKILSNKKKLLTLGIITIIITTINIYFYGYKNFDLKTADIIHNVSIFSNINIIILKFIIYIMLCILFLLILKYKDKKITIIFTIIFVSINFFNTINYVNIEDTYKFNQQMNNNKKFTNYRTENVGTNKINSIEAQTSSIYTSLENSDYFNFLRNDIEIEKNESLRVIKNDIFQNNYMKEFLSIDSKKGIIYGVNEKNTCNINDYKELKPLDRTYSINQCLFVNDSTNKYKDSYNIIKLRNDSKKFNISKKETINIPKEYQDGILTINFKVDYNKIKGKGNVSINEHKNKIMYKDFYGVYHNEEVTFLIDTKDINKLNIKSTVKTKNKEDLPFSDLKVYYQSIEDFNENLMPTTDIQNLEVDMNNSYDFDINMKDNGYLATTIPYDKGFKIYIDGKEQEVEKMNGRFIGSKITKGNHHVKIDFHIAGFNLGLSLSLIGLLLLIIEIIKDSNILIKIKKNNKN